MENERAGALCRGASMKQVAVLTPLPPVKSGIAGYSAMLLPALAKRFDITAVADQESITPALEYDIVSFAEFAETSERFDAVVCQLGNNPHHEFAFRWAYAHPSIVVLHDLVLHHLIVEMTLARGDVEQYVALLRDSHGAEGEAIARSRAIGFHQELANFFYPASTGLANRSRAVIVHNQYAARRLAAEGVVKPVEVVGHPLLDSVDRSSERDSARAEFGYGANDRVVGMFGFVTSAKRPATVFAAFARARSVDPSLRLLVVGESAPNVDLESLAQQYELPAGSWKWTGYVSDEEFDRYLAAVDRVVNLRYPTAGESSGALLHVFQTGRPVAVNGYAQFAEYPDDIVTKIPFGQRETDDLARFMTSPLDVPSIAARQRTWLRENASIDATVDGYERVIERTNTREVRRPRRLASMPLFPRLALEQVDVSASATKRIASVTLRNLGSSILTGPEWGVPSYRLIAKLFDGERYLSGSWYSLPRDVSPGDAAVVDIPLNVWRSGMSLRFHHALAALEPAEREPFAVWNFEDAHV